MSSAKDFFRLKVFPAGCKVSVCHLQEFSEPLRWLVLELLQGFLSDPTIGPVFLVSLLKVSCLLVAILLSANCLSQRCCLPVEYFLSAFKWRCLPDIQTCCLSLESFCFLV
jgi:hypothetical protein